MIQLCFRLDDPSPTSNQELERRIVALFSREAMPLTVAVVPTGGSNGREIALRPEHVSHLIEARDRSLVEIAQHGFSHQERSRTRSGLPSEFCSLRAAEQRD